MSEIEVSGLDGKGLGRVARVANIREVWAHEASDFTPWLYDNLSDLAEAIGVPLTPLAIEHPVGPYRLDILAADAEGRTVAIENQVEPADHSHLGQLVLYAAHVEAATAVWLSPKFRDEQRQALLWLNEKTIEGVRFFAVEVGVVRIGGSAPAPVFNVVVRPNDLQKADRGTVADSATLSDKRVFLDDVMRRVAARIPAFRVPSGSSWTTDVWFRSGPYGYFHLAFARGSLRSEVYLDCQDPELTRRLYDAVYEERYAVEKALGFELRWERLEAYRASRIAAYRSFDLPADEQATEAAAEWATGCVVSMLEVLERRLRHLVEKLRQALTAGAL